MQDQADRVLRDDPALMDRVGERLVAGVDLETLATEHAYGVVGAPSRPVADVDRPWALAHDEVHLESRWLVPARRRVAAEHRALRRRAVAQERPAVGEVLLQQRVLRPVD